MKKGDKFICESTGGGGTQQDEGVWIVKTKTDKTLVMEVVNDGYFSDYEIGATLRIGARFPNPVEFWDDGTFTVYPNQAGTPYYFEPVEAK